MSTAITVSKLEAARRHLRGAIVMLFEGADPVIVHTLVGVASVLAADLARHHHPTEQWEVLAQSANGLTANQYFTAARATQNFLKHADRDVDDVHTFDPTDTDALAFGASRNLAAFGRLGLVESTFEFWYFATNDVEGWDDTDAFKIATRYFGDLRGVPRPLQLAKGRDVLAKLRATREPTQG